MFSLVTGIFSSVVGNIKFYKNLIIIGVILSIIGFLYFYINGLKHDIIVRDNNITQLVKTNNELHDQNIKNELVYKINEKALNDAITSQNNIIEKFRMDQVKAMKTYKDSIVKITSDYESKIQSVRDSNISEAVEYKTLTGIIDKELK
jgi:cell division protein FtsB